MAMISPVTFTPLTPALHITGAQPNEFDLRRLKRMLEKRERYRYVTVSITPTPNGYHITSPCCSRSISPDGKAIDIALIEYDEPSLTWKLYGMNHSAKQWHLQRCAEALRPLVEYLITDPHKVFWQ
ncbi:MAG: DUF3024 domain-containing protein [Oxalobacter sp.]|nr:MAG: DUF3024 domain-containing protein [Oxalobacter sp.]